jgi:nitrate reductase NapE component
MSKFTINLDEPKTSSTIVSEKSDTPLFSEVKPPKKRSGLIKALKITGIALAAVLLVAVVGGYFYWQSLKSTPQYSLALLVDAARRDDQKAIDELVDTDAVVDDFMPQVTAKAIELYGRGLPPAVIQRVEQQAAPLMPAIKQRARAEVPGLIREKTKPFEGFPFWAIAVGAKSYMTIVQEGDKALITSKIPDRPLELTMKRNGDKWQVVGIKDDVLARKIAEKIGQSLIAAAQKGALKKAGEQMGIQNLQDLQKNLEGLFR